MLTGADTPTPSVIIVIPAYKAEATIDKVVRGAKRHGLPVVVIDDGSDDRTGQLAEQAGATVLRHAGNRGKGAALQTGFAYALERGADAVLTLDADGQHDTDEIPELVAVARAAPGSLVIGVRSFDPRLMPRRSRIGNQISTFFISRFAHRRHSDTQSGFRLYPRRLLSAPLTTRRFDTETELLLWAAKLGVPLREVPIQTIYPSSSSGERHTTHFRNWEDTLRVLRLVIGSPLWRAPRADLPCTDSAPPSSEVTT